MNWWSNIFVPQLFLPKKSHQQHQYKVNKVNSKKQKFLHIVIWYRTWNFFLKLQFLSICPNKSNWPYSDLFSYKCVVGFFCFLTQTLLVMQWISYLVTEWIYFFGHTDTSFFAKTSYHYMYVVLGLAQDVHCNVFDHLLNVLASHLSWDVVIYHSHSFLDS